MKQIKNIGRILTPEEKKNVQGGGALAVYTKWSCTFTPEASCGGGGGWVGTGCWPTASGNPELASPHFCCIITNCTSIGVCSFELMPTC